MSTSTQSAYDSTTSQAFSTKIKKIGRPPAASSADVLARSNVLYVTSADQPNRITFSFGNRKLDLYGIPQPFDPWVEPVMESLCKRWGEEKGWDSYGAEPTSEECVKVLLTNLFPLMQRDSLPPIIIPLADGGVQAEWHYKEQALELAFPAGDVPATYFYSNDITGLEEEDLFKGNFGHVRSLIESLRK